MPICPVCGGTGKVEPNHFNKELRDAHIRKIAKALEGKRKQEVLFRITRYLQLKGVGLSERQIYRVLNKTGDEARVK